MDAMREHEPMLITVPMDVDKYDGRVIMGQLVVSKGMIPHLWEAVRRHSSQAKRRFAEVPYSTAEDLRGASLDQMIFEHLQHTVMRDAMQDKESIVSMSPVRLTPWGNGVGMARMEYTTVPLTPWKD
jgi:hypothetical protein